MPDEFQEGDWVRHSSRPDPVRVIGSTIAVRFPNGDMQAFDPCALQKVPGPGVRKAQIHEYRRGGLLSPNWLTAVCLLCLIFVVLVLIATRIL